MRKVIIPEANKKDLEEIPDLIKEKLEIITVKHMDRVLDVALVPKALEEDLPSEDAIEYLPAVERKTWPDAVHGSTQ
jgi:predicted ATP-dependent protease